MNETSVVIVASKRTPMGQNLGCFASLSASQLGSFAIQACLNQVTLSSHDISEVLMGCVLTAGQGQAPARQAALGAGLPNQVGCTTINKMCGSGMKTMMIAFDHLQAGNESILIAGGMESMTHAPYLVLKGREGYRLGHSTLYDHMFLDGLEDAYEKGMLMGVFAERCAEKYGFSRQVQDEYAIRSVQRAKEAIAQDRLATEIVPITIQNKNESISIIHDELSLKANPEKIPHLKPVFKPDGTVTAANASAISDGAAAHIMMLESDAQKRKISPLAKILGYASHAQDPAWFTTAPIYAIQKLLQKINWKINEVDLFEINEAFAVVPLATMKELNIPAEKINIRGGACVMGHPIGASGARIVTTLIYALQQQGLKRGIAALCIGGGEATAMAIEVCP